jgi:phage shock protein A
MSNNYNELLEQGIEKIKELENNIKNFETATKLSENMSDSLQKSVAAIKDISKEVKPINQLQLKKFKWTVIIALIINIVLSMVILMMTIINK